MEQLADIDLYTYEDLSFLHTNSITKAQASNSSNDELGTKNVNSSNVVVIKYFAPRDIVPCENTQNSPSSTDELEGSDNSQLKKRKLGKELDITFNRTYI